MELSIINFNELINCHPFLDGFSIFFPMTIQLLGMRYSHGFGWMWPNLERVLARNWIWVWKTLKMVVFFIGKMMINWLTIKFLGIAYVQTKNIYVFGFVWSKIWELSISIDPFDLPHETKWQLRPQFLDQPHFTGLNSASATTAQQLRLSNYGSATTAQQPRLSNHGSATTAQQPN